MLAVYVCEFALGEGEVAEVAVFRGVGGSWFLSHVYLCIFVGGTNSGKRSRVYRWRRGLVND